MTLLKKREHFLFKFVKIHVHFNNINNNNNNNNNKIYINNFFLNAETFEYQSISKYFFLHSVTLLMRIKKSPANKSFITDIAAIWSLSCMVTSMNNKSTLLCERFSTLFT